MGSRMAATLARGGYALDVFDVDPAKTRAVAAVGAAAAASARAVAERSDVVFTSLPWPATVREVYLGAGGVVEGARPGTILIDMSTVDPETARAVHAAAAARGVHHLDAPVSGGYREAENGTLVIIVGGERDAFERAKPVLEVLGASVHHAGPSGAGNIVKLVNNVMSMGNMLVAAEVFVLGVKAGMDPKTLFEILRTSAGRSYHFERRCPTSWPGTSRRASRWTSPGRTWGSPSTWPGATTSRSRPRACSINSTTRAARSATARTTSRPS